MQANENLCYPVEAVSLFFAAIQSNMAFQIIQFIITTIGILVSIAYTIWKWYKKAHEDGKITGEEVGELIEQVKPDVEKLTDHINEGVKKDDSN